MVSVSDGTPLIPAVWNPFYESSSPRAVVVINGTRYAPKSYEISLNAHGVSDTATIELPISSGTDLSVDLFRGQQIAGPKGGAALPTSAPIVPTFQSGGISTGTQGPNTVTDDETPVYAEIYFGYPSKPSPNDLDISQLQPRFIGIVDLYRPSFHADSVSFACRSLASPLVDQKITNVTLNQPITSFIEQQAAALGIDVVFNLPSGYVPITVQEILGREFIGGSNLNAALYGKRVYDLILQGAQFDDVDVWADNVNGLLRYEAPSLVERNGIGLAWGRDLEEVDGEHSIAFSKRVQVEVRTYQRKTRTNTVQRITSDGFGGYSETTSTKVVSSQPVFGTNETVTTSTSPDGTVTVGTSSGSGGGFGTTTSEGKYSDVDKYPFYVPNLSPQRVIAFARAMWRQISSMEYRSTFTLPMTKQLLEQLDITSALLISGLPYGAFNAKYYPRRITETFSLDEGCKLRIEAVTNLGPPGAV